MFKSKRQTDRTTERVAARYGRLQVFSLPKGDREPLPTRCRKLRPCFEQLSSIWRILTEKSQTYHPRWRTFAECLMLERITRVQYMNITRGSSRKRDLCNQIRSDKQEDTDRLFKRDSMRFTITTSQIHIRNNTLNSAWYWAPLKNSNGKNNTITNPIKNENNNEENESSAENKNWRTRKHVLA